MPPGQHRLASARARSERPAAQSLHGRPRHLRVPVQVTESEPLTPHSSDRHPGCLLVAADAMPVLVRPQTSASRGSSGKICPIHTNVTLTSRACHLLKVNFLAFEAALHLHLGVSDQRSAVLPYGTGSMNTSMRQSPENRGQHLPGSASQTGVISSTFMFRQTLTQRRLGPAPYLILMRDYHNRSRWRRFARLVSPAGS